MTKIQNPKKEGPHLYSPGQCQNIDLLGPEFQQNTGTFIDGCSGSVYYLDLV